MIDSGRVLMLLLNLAMIHRLYRVAREIGCGVAAAAFGRCLFALSPLASAFTSGRMLDSFMLFWVLISLDLLLDGQGRLSRVALSGACFGIALLSKETAIFVLPAMLLLAFQERRAHHGLFAVTSWLLPMVMVTSWYLLYATLKGELLPVSISARMFGNTQPHVSLIETLLWQMKRDGGGMFNLNNQFWTLVRSNLAGARRLAAVGQDASPRGQSAARPPRSGGDRLAAACCWRRCRCSTWRAAGWSSTSTFSSRHPFCA